MDNKPLEVPGKAQAEYSSRHKKEKESRKAIRCDIQKIDEVLQKEDMTEMRDLHRNLDGKYQACIADWGQSMVGYYKRGFDHEELSSPELMNNLLLMKSKLEALQLGWNGQSTVPHVTENPRVNVTVNNTVHISISFDEARQKIEDMTALNQKQTDEILEKINALEEIAKESSSRKTKWEKVKPILAFALDKGADVAVTFMSLILQMKLGI